tara:strand:- start:458 stop:1177 length:720 start_codon:yes stop_codon:yes gene_type:complete
VIAVADGAGPAISMSSSRKRPLKAASDDVIDLTADERPTIDLTADDEPASSTSAEKASQSSGSRQSQPSSRQCPVCLEPLGEAGRPVQALGCVHVFCRECIARCIMAQLERHRAPDCPVCKRVVPPEEQRACGVEPGDAALPAASTVDMFAPSDDDDLDGPAQQRAELRATFHRAPEWLVHRSSHEPMRLLDQHMQHQRHAQRDAGADVDGRRRPRPSVPHSSRGSGGRGRGRQRVSWP